MDANYGSIGRAQARERSGARTALALGAGGFLLGAVVVGLLWWNGIGSGDLVRIVREEAVEPVAVSSPTPTPQASPSEAAQLRAAAEVERVAEQQGGLDSRVAAMEQRLARLDLQTQAAAGNAARAEGLLVSFAARRALARGAPLGYLADQLQLRFGDAHPNSVRTIVEFSRQPVTLDELAARLDGLASTLVVSPKNETPLSWLGREISSMFVVRSESTHSPRPERRLDRARFFIQSGRVRPAIAEVENLPNASEADRWIVDAERYVRAREALDLLETTAILEPRELRDGTGQRILQPSPASDNEANAGAT